RLTGNVFGRGRPAARAGGAQRASAGSGGPASNVSPATLGGFTRGETGNPGPLRLFNAALGDQVSWLLPLALLGLVVAGLRTRWLTPLVVAVCLIAAGLLALARPGARVSRPVIRGAIVAGMLALLAAPTAWAAETVGAGGGLMPRAGPAPQTGAANGFARNFA